MTEKKLINQFNQKNCCGDQNLVDEEIGKEMPEIINQTNKIAIGICIN